MSGYHVLKDIPIVKLVNSAISDVSVLADATVVHLEDCHNLVDVSPLRGVRELTLSFCSQLEDISMLRKVQKLTLDNLPKLNNYEGINQMTDLSIQVTNSIDEMLKRFPNARHLECSSFLLDNILPLLQTFTNLHSLTFRSLHVKIEFSINVHTVFLEECMVKNISCLRKARVVRLLNCVGDVLDVSSLASVPLVSIIKCRCRHANYESLKNVPRFKLDDIVLD